MGKRQCKTCGNFFEPKNSNDRYCSQLCRQAGCYIGGGGDTSKPNSTIVVKSAPKKARVSKPNNTDGYQRVKEMLSLPVGERWKIAKDFTEEERAYARRLAKKSLMDDRIVTKMSDWSDDDGDEENEVVTEMFDRLGDSDDGSV